MLNEIEFLCETKVCDISMVLWDWRCFFSFKKVCNFFEARTGIVIWKRSPVTIQLSSPQKWQIITAYIVLLFGKITLIFCVGRYVIERDRDKSKRLSQRMNSYILSYLLCRLLSNIWSQIRVNGIVEKP